VYFYHFVYVFLPLHRVFKAGSHIKKVNELLKVIGIDAGLVSSMTLANQRPYVIVGAFVIGMLLTPPDAFPNFIGHPNVAAI
jgi:hypothetical protein